MSRPEDHFLHLDITVWWPSFRIWASYGIIKHANSGALLTLGLLIMLYRRCIKNRIQRCFHMCWLSWFGPNCGGLDSPQLMTDHYSHQS